MKIRFFMLWFCALAMFTGCTEIAHLRDQSAFRADQDRAAKAIENIPVSKARFFVYSLEPGSGQIATNDPAALQTRTFCGYPVLGCIELVPEGMKQHVLQAFADGVRKKTDSFSMLCFMPRHGLAVVGESFTNEFVICYSCLKVKASGFAPSHYFLTTSQPGMVFDELFDKYGIKKAE